MQKSELEKNCPLCRAPSLREFNIAYDQMDKKDGIIIFYLGFLKLFIMCIFVIIFKQ